MRTRLSKQKKKNLLSKTWIKVLLILSIIFTLVFLGGIFIDTSEKDKVVNQKEEQVISEDEYSMQIESIVEDIGLGYQSMYDDYSIQNFSDMSESTRILQEASINFNSIETIPTGYDASHQQFKMFFIKQDLMNIKINQGIQNQDWAYMYSDEFNSDLEEAKYLLDNAIMEYNNDSGEDFEI